MLTHYRYPRSSLCTGEKCKLVLVVDRVQFLEYTPSPAKLDKKLIIGIETVNVRRGYRLCPYTAAGNKQTWHERRLVRFLVDWAITFSSEFRDRFPPAELTCLRAYYTNA